MAPSNIAVQVRLRPHKSSDGGCRNSSITINGNTVTIDNGEKLRTQNWKFQRCLDEHSIQEDVFEGIKPIIKKVCKGMHATIFTYGVTGSGKTHTMEGSVHDPGVIPRTVKALFDKQKFSPDEVELSFSYLEIFNKGVYDLLGDRRSIFENELGDNIISGLLVKPITKEEDFARLYSQAAATRKTAATATNSTSSRSHAILTLYVTSGSGDERCTGKLCLADLAGSENSKSAGSNADRIQESKAINQSLSALRAVIAALKDNSSRIPYRDSQLTRVLQPALGGDSAALLICCIAPGDKYLQDTINTLLFGDHTKQVVNNTASTQSAAQRSRNSCSAISAGRPSSVSNGTTRRASDIARPTSSSARRSLMVLSDTTNTSHPPSIMASRTAQPRAIRGLSIPAGVQTIEMDKENLRADKKENVKPSAEAEQAVEVILEQKDLVAEFAQSFERTSDEGKRALCSSLLPTLAPLLREHLDEVSSTFTAPIGDAAAGTAEHTPIAIQASTSVPPSPASSTASTANSETTIRASDHNQIIAQRVTQSLIGSSAVLSAATLAEVDEEISRLDSLSPKSKDAYGRLYSKKGRSCLAKGETQEANKLFRIAKACAKDASSLMSLIADIEVNGLEGKLVKMATKRRREAVTETVDASPSKKARVIA